MVVWLTAASLSGYRLATAPTYEVWSRDVTVWSPDGERRVAPLDDFYTPQSLKKQADGSLILHVAKGDMTGRVAASAENRLSFVWDPKTERFEKLRTSPTDSLGREAPAFATNVFPLAGGEVATVTGSPDARRLTVSERPSPDPPPLRWTV